MVASNSRRLTFSLLCLALALSPRVRAEESDESDLRAIEQEYADPEKAPAVEPAASAEPSPAGPKASHAKIARQQPHFHIKFKRKTLAAKVETSHTPKHRKLSDEQREIRLKHARELLGRYYKHSSAKVGEQVPKINSAIYHWTKEHLPEKYKDQSGKIAQTIIDEATKQEFDPVFLMSVIEGESSWRPDKIGSVGEIGLMQLRPSTGKWMAAKAGVKWKGDKTLHDPCSNIKLGAAYLHYLRDRFDDHARLYLAAYNMGQGNVNEALDKKIWPKDYPIHVMKRYVEFYETLGETLVTKDEDRQPTSTTGPGVAVPTKALPATHGRRDQS